MVLGHRLALVPYLPHHVVQYHEWMQRPELLADTCSEPLSLAEEVENQVAWLNSSDKLTFILLAPSSLISGEAACADSNLRSQWTMIGDCNIFVPHDVEDQGVEVEVMIAEPSFRRKGLAREAVALLMCYAMETLPHRRFVAKILEDNAASRALFEGALGFHVFKEVKVFNEIHSDRHFADDADREALKSLCGFQLKPYERHLDVAGT